MLGRPSAARRAARRIVQECGAGLVPIRQDGDRLAFAAPKLLREGPVDEATMRDILAVLRIDRAQVVEARWADNGPGWVGVMLASAEEVLAVEPVRHHEGRIDIGLVGAHPPGAEVAWEIRTVFGDGTGALVEDPVTGSFNAAVAGWLRETGRATGPYVAAQGTRLGRRGRIFVDYDGADWIGGRTLTVAEGTIPKAPCRAPPASDRPAGARGQAARTPDRKRPIDVVRAEVWRPRSWTTCSIADAASPVAPTSLRTALMLPETDRDPVAACCTLWAISPVAAPCSRIAPSCPRWCRAVA